LIVRGFNEENPNLDTYDFDLSEHVIFMADWMHGSAEDHMPGMVKRSSLSQSILINGHGRFFNVSQHLQMTTDFSIEFLTILKSFLVFLEDLSSIFEMFDLENHKHDISRPNPSLPRRLRLSLPLQDHQLWPQCLPFPLAS
jgi:hypothetical protein